MAVDLTRDSDQILQKASSIVTENEAKITVVNIVPLLAHHYAYVNYSIYLQNWDDYLIEESEKNLTNQLSNLNITPHRIIVKKGHVANSIRSLSTKLDIDLIIIGTHGRSGVNKFILGSTAHSLLGGIEIDVLIFYLNKNRVFYINT